MYRKIVLAVDPDGLADSVLPILATLARLSGGQVFVLGAPKSGEAPERLAALERHVRNAASELTEAGMNARGEVRVAQPIAHLNTRPVLVAGRPAHEPQRSSASQGW